LTQKLYRTGDPVDNLSVNIHGRPLSLEYVESMCSGRTIYAMDKPDLYIYRSGVFYRYDNESSSWTDDGVPERVPREFERLSSKASLPFKPGEIVLMGYYNSRLRAYLRYGTFDRLWFPADVFREYYADASSPLPYCETRKRYRYAFLYSLWRVDVFKVGKDL